MVRKLVLKFAIQIPYPKVSSSRRGQAATARAPGKMFYPVGSTFQYFGGSIAAHMPNAGDPILSARGKVMAIWRPGHAQNAAFMGLNNLQFRPGRGLHQTKGAVRKTHGQPLTIRGPA
jgi:hypothetical protein